jgi:hypothetical protein
MTFDADDQAPFVVRNNAAFGLEDRELVIDVTEGVDGETIPSGKIGSVTFKLDDLEGRCSLDGAWVDTVQSMHSESCTFSGGELRISVMKQRAGSDYVTQKRTEILQALKNLMDMVKKYNIDPNRQSDEKLSGNIQGINGLSVLHAAVHLGDSGYLISTMLDLGADPRLKSQLGTPLHFAQQQLDRALEKEKNLEAKNASVEELNRQRERCKHVKELVEMLHTDTGSSQNERVGADIDVVRVPTTKDSEQGIVNESSRTEVTGKEDESEGETGRVLSWNEECLTNLASENSGVVTNEGSSVGFGDSSHHRRPSLSLPYGMLDDSKTDIDNERRVSFLPKLPHLPSIEWAPLPHASNRRCSFNLKGCFHLRSRSCRYWHDIFTPLSLEEMKVIPRSTRLPPQLVSVKEEGHLWTAVFADQSTKRFIHAQDIFQEGHTSSQGISWFASRASAEAAMERTVAILREVEGSSPQNQNPNSGDKGKSGRKRRNKGKLSQKQSSIPES